MRRFWLVRLAVGVLAAGSAGVAAAQPTSSYKPIDPVTLPLDRAGVWTFHFSYQPPRIVTVDVPKQGKKTVWYMVYKVWNTSDTPQSFVPTFELVTKDGPLQKFLDEPQPSVADQIRRIEDPQKALDIQTSVSISKVKIPVTRPDSVPRAVTGVAIWLDAPAKAAVTNNFSVYVTGLSNGLAVQQAADGTETVSRKTLQLDFLKPTDNANPAMTDIQPNDNNGRGSTKWIYRVVPARKLDAATPVAEGK